MKYSKCVRPFLVSRKFGHYFGMYGKANTYFWTRWAISRSIVTSVVLLHLMRSGQVSPASRRGVVRQVGENHALFIIILAEDLVVTKEKAIANAKPATKEKLLEFLQKKERFTCR